MIEVHRGAGMLVPVIGILAALLMNIVTAKVFGHSYYQQHIWPKLTVLLVAGTGCLAAGIAIERKRSRDASKEREYIESLSPKFETVKRIAYAGPRDHLMFVPVKYWAIVYFAAAVIYAVKSL
jgi:hypothetical protein